MQKCDRVIIGAGLYGLYAALLCAKRGESVVVLEKDDAPFCRATYINQARVHQGYHYPRSLGTAQRSAHYFARFNSDYGFCVNKAFDQVYATSAAHSWTSAEQFVQFCRAANIPCQELAPSQYFKSGMCDGAFLTQEYTYDAAMLRDYFLEKLSDFPRVSIHCGCEAYSVHQSGDMWEVSTRGGGYSAPFVLNAAYAAANQVLRLTEGAENYEPFKIKYELCEIILCEAGGRLKDCGITVMDGPFFSIMPFGLTGLHSLTAVSFTPHDTCHDELPSFACQKHSNGYCSPDMLGNCNGCAAKPATAFPYMANLARKYLRDEYSFHYARSLFSMKPILAASEVDDSRPTVIKVHSRNPAFVSVLSGKINTVYDIDEVLNDT